MFSERFFLGKNIRIFYGKILMAETGKCAQLLHNILLLFTRLLTRFSVKKVVLKIFSSFTGNTCIGVSF